MYLSLSAFYNKSVELQRTIIPAQDTTHFYNKTIEGVRARVSQPSIYNSLPVCFIRTFKENRQELYIEGWPTLSDPLQFMTLSFSSRSQFQSKSSYPNRRKSGLLVCLKTTLSLFCSFSGICSWSCLRAV